MKKDLWLKHKRKCALCGRFMKLKDVTVDHIIPKSKGGDNHIDNYQPAHARCNSIKGNTLPKDFKGKLKTNMLTPLRMRKIPTCVEKSINYAWENSQRNMVEMFKKARELMK